MTEEGEGQPVFRSFGTSFEGDRLRFGMMLESPANVSLFKAGKKLLAFGEQSPPWEIDPESLETSGEFFFDRSLNKISPFSAHPKTDPETGGFCNFGIRYRPDKTSLCYWEFDRDLGLRVESSITLGDAPCVHDFSISRDFACFYVSPYTLDIEQFVAGGSSFHEALRFAPDRESRVIVLSRADGQLVAEVELEERGHCLHQVGATQQAGELVLDVIQTPRPLYDEYIPLPDLFTTVAACSCRRIRIGVGDWVLLEEQDYPQPFHMDFPTTAGGDYRAGESRFWTLAMDVEPCGESKYYHRLLRFHWGSGLVEDQCLLPEGLYFSGEPAIALDPGSRESGTAICPVWNAREGVSEFRFLDAFDLGAAPVARCQLPVLDQLAFHSTFAPC